MEIFAKSASEMAPKPQNLIQNPGSERCWRLIQRRVRAQTKLSQVLIDFAKHDQTVARMIK